MKEKEEKILTAFRIEKDMKKLADKSIEIRYLLFRQKKNKTKESFSSYLRNLILEDYNRNKMILENLKKDEPL